jgi:putative Holliday junction resolvase
MQAVVVNIRRSPFWQIGILLLFAQKFCDGFFLFETSFRSIKLQGPLYAVEDDIAHAAARTSLNGVGDTDILQVAAGVTRETNPLLGLKSVGVDYGLARTGVAVTVGYDPKPLTILSDLNSTEICKQVVQICRTEQTNQVIVGLPLHKNGTEANQTTITRVFAAELAVNVIKGLGPKVPVYMFDERYTSKEAAARLWSKNPNSDLYGTLDAEAACIILESYYNDCGVGAELVKVEPPELYEKYERIWEEKKALDEERLNADQKDREDRLRWRKEAMQRDRQMEEANTQSKASKKKKKKKKKR